MHSSDSADRPPAWPDWGDVTSRESRKGEERAGSLLRVTTQDACPQSCVCPRVVVWCPQKQALRWGLESTLFLSGRWD